LIFSSGVAGLSSGQTGSDLADFLLGIPHTISLAAGNADKLFGASGYDLGISDD
jgi:hypothetical protein